MKTIAKHLLSRLGLLSARIHRRGDSFVMMFHGVGGRDMPEKSFSALLAELSRIFQIRPMDNLPGSLSAAGGSRPSLFLTFDDGLRNNATIAYPILKQLGLSATFYLCPGLIGKDQWIWTHEMRCRLQSLPPERLTNLAREIYGAPLPVETFIRRMKESALADRLAAEQQVRQATPGFAATAAQHAEFDLMSWDEARSLDPGIISIGSHSMTHQLLDSATPAELEAEIGDSRILLERNLGRPVSHFCFPDGRHSEAAIAMARAHYITAVTTKAAPLFPGANLHALPRVGSDQDIAEALWRLARCPVAR
jgi:peptidoglycan/xylan/chitin deacetylase (PgdA/CDA1 family)